MELHFDWNIVSVGAPYITVSTLGLNVNSAAAELLGSPERVEVGFDKKMMAVAIRRAGDDSNVHAYEFAKKEKTGWMRIGCKNFIQYVSSLTGVSYKPAKKYIAHYDEAQGLLYILLSEASVNESKKT